MHSALLRGGLVGLQLVLLLAVKVVAEANTAVSTAAISLSDVKVSVLAQDGSVVSSRAGSLPEKLLSNPQIPHTQSLEVSLSARKDGSDFKPQQVMLALKSKVSGLSAYAVGKVKKGSTYSITINSAAVEKQLGKQGGEYEVSLLVGDPSAPKAISWSLGTAELILSPAAGVAPINAVRTADFQPLNNVKPEIHHIFRSPDKRPPAVVSLAFTALAFVPLVATILFILGALRINFKGVPVDSGTKLAALVFHGSIAAMLVLYMLFWTTLNLLQTLPLVLAVGVVIALSGYKALSGLSSSRLKKD